MCRLRIFRRCFGRQETAGCAGADDQKGIRMLSLLLIEDRMIAGHCAAGPGIEAATQVVGRLSEHHPGWRKPIAA
jgi:hypothetical protein